MPTTKFMIMSDTHNFVAEEHPNCPLSQPLPKVDVLLHCGDLTQIGGLSAYKKALRMFEASDAELKLVIAGNHDISLDKEYWAANLDEEAGDEPEEHDEAVAIMTGPLAKKAGVTYLTEGTHKFTLKNGTSFSIFVSPYQPECGDWAFGYPRNSDRWDIPEDIYIVMTHGPPHGVLDHAHDQHVGCETLLIAVEKSRPLMHCFGHIHEGHGTEVKHWGAKSDEKMEKTSSVMVAAGREEAKHVDLIPGQDTLMVNAAIMDEKNQPANAPWVVDLHLA